MKNTYHDFNKDEVVYLMYGKQLYKGIVFKYDPHYEYVNVKWLNQGGGGGSPHYSSLHRSKEDAISEWYREELIKLERTHKRLLNSKI